jgi:hypothetical protein
VRWSPDRIILYIVIPVIFVGGMILIGLRNGWT